MCSAYYEFIIKKEIRNNNKLIIKKSFAENVLQNQALYGII